MGGMKDASNKPPLIGALDEHRWPEDHSYTSLHPHSTQRRTDERSEMTWGGGGGGGRSNGLCYLSGTVGISNWV